MILKLSRYSFRVLGLFSILITFNTIVDTDLHYSTGKYAVSPDGKYIAVQVDYYKSEPGAGCAELIWKGVTILRQGKRVSKIYPGVPFILESYWEKIGLRWINVSTLEVNYIVGPESEELKVINFVRSFLYTPQTQMLGKSRVVRQRSSKGNIRIIYKKTYNKYFKYD